MQDKEFSQTINLEWLNLASIDEFVARLGGIVEHSPWVAEQVFAARPFESVWLLHAALVNCIANVSRDQQLALVRLHPELAGSEAAEGMLTESSNAEQARLGLLCMPRDEHEKLLRMNAQYSQQFGFPCIVALRLHANLASVIESFEQRLRRDAQTELSENLRQIGEVLRGRLARMFGTPLGWLSTHVLDSVVGGPAVGMAFDIAVQDVHGWRKVGKGVTNDEGRTDRPVLVDAAMARNVFQFEFQVGDYYRNRGVKLSALPFLDRVPLRFGIDDPDMHYHVPLLCTPWTYSSYRGS